MQKVERQKHKDRRRKRLTGVLLCAALLAVCVTAGLLLKNEAKEEPAESHKPITGAIIRRNEEELRSLTVTDPYATPEATGVVIALQGLPESPEFKANAAWMDYLAGIDLDAAAADAEAVDAPYELYTVYNADMARQLDAVAGEYGLRLHTSARDFFSEGELCSLLGAQSFISDCAALSGYVYEDGSFQADGTNVSDKCYEYQLGLYRKGVFSEVTLNIGDAEGYEEWTYTTVSGTEVQLSMSPDRCVLMADLPDAFVAVNLLGGTAGNSVFMPDPVTREDLQAFADMFNFSALA